MSYIIGPVYCRIQRGENDVNLGGHPNEAQGDTFAFRIPQMWTNPRGRDQQSGTACPDEIDQLGMDRQTRRAPAAFAPR